MGITLLVTVDKKTKVSKMFLKITLLGNYLVVQWLGLGVFIAEGPGSIPGRGR